jgi:hypothetical protein
MLARAQEGNHLVGGFAGGQPPLDLGLQVSTGTLLVEQRQLVRYLVGYSA